MKKSIQFFFGLCMLILSINIHAQSKAGAEYFNGKWSVLLKGTPNGDAKLIFVLESKNDSISGIVQDTAGVEVSKIDNVELKDNEVTLYFNVQSYDVNLLLTKKDDDHVTGSLMNMFEAEGVRVKTVKQIK
jgi:hypothetical protein